MGKAKSERATVHERKESGRRAYDRPGREGADSDREGSVERQALFDDSNQGKISVVKTSVLIYLSLFNPDGNGILPKDTANLKPGTPLLWVIGTRDPLFESGAPYAFDKAPPHPLSKYLVVEADHFGAPRKAASDIIAWIKGL